MASVNYVTSHDGFTLADLVSYNGKHNQANGEDNSDGTDDNRSWNCGAEGPSDDPAVSELRARQVRNFLATLFCSQGVPMLLAGDEMGRTQQGNNNGYCQDSPVSWVDWENAARIRGPGRLHRRAVRAAPGAPGVPAAPVLQRAPRPGRPGRPAGHRLAHPVRPGNDRCGLARRLREVAGGVPER